ncbi:MAG: hypothetical protein WAN51_03310 [Alphaproteobacteria bacterium]
MLLNHDGQNTPITPEMVNAGISAFHRYIPRLASFDDLDADELPDFVAALFLAMSSARQKPCRSST